VVETMWIEKKSPPRSKESLFRTHSKFVRDVFTVSETKKLHRKNGDLYNHIKATSIMIFGYTSASSKILRHLYALSEKKAPKYKKFGISLEGIKVNEKEISIDPRKLEPNVFYLFSYKDEKYVARKTDENVVEIYEVIE